MTTHMYDNQTVKQLIHHRDQILQILRQKGYRITNQRKIIIDVILKKDCSSCKEIFYQANAIDPTIGIATVYRMIKTLEEIEAIDRKNMYTIDYGAKLEWNKELFLYLKSKKVLQMSMKEWKIVMEEGLRARGYLYMDEIENVVVKRK